MASSNCCSYVFVIIVVLCKFGISPSNGTFLNTTVTANIILSTLFYLSRLIELQMPDQADLETPYNIEVLPNARSTLGEGPHWNIENQSLYMVDVEEGSLLRYDYRQNKTYRAKVVGEQYASFIIPVAGMKNKFAVGCGRNVVIVNWDGVCQNAIVEKILFSVEPEYDNRFNDAKCDSRGRLFGGTMIISGDCSQKHTAALYLFEKRNQMEILKTDVGISNGMSWNEKLKKFYYTDTCDQEVKVYDYNVKTGAISNQRVFFKVQADDPANLLYPDGMSIDSDGNIYIALYQGSGIYKIDSTGKLLEKIGMPCKHITSMAFGGPNLDELFVTSSNRDDTSVFAGETFKITGLKAKGLPMNKLKI